MTHSTVATGASTFLFSTKLPAGTAYAVAVAVQPIGLNCQVINAARAMPFAAVTNVTVACGQWAWVSGSGQTGAAGTYGTEGTPAAANVPGARAAATSWIDSSGDLWLFGGTGANGALNDLWKYSPGAGLWTWVSGSNSANASRPLRCWQVSRRVAMCRGHALVPTHGPTVPATSGYSVVKGMTRPVQRAASTTCGNTTSARINGL